MQWLKVQKKTSDMEKQMNFYPMKMSSSAVYILSNTGLMHYAHIQPEWKSQAYIQG